MTQSVGLITYLKLKAKALFKKRVSPSSSKSSSKAYRGGSLDEFYNYKTKKVYTNSKGGTTIKVNGQTYNLMNGDVLVVNGKTYKAGTPEFEEFKKEMDAFDKEMTRFGEEMGRMGKEMGTSAEEMAKSMRNMFK